MKLICTLYSFMENSITKIADLPSDGGINQSQHPSRMQPPETISISNLKNKQESDLPTNYTPINVHPNPYGVSDKNPIIDPPMNQQSENITMEHFANQPSRNELPQQFRDQIESMPTQNLPSRDIPMNTDNYNMDAQVQPNYIPKENSKDYVKEHYDMTEQNLREYEQKKYRENAADAILNDIQMPVFITVLFFLFQMPMMNQLIFKKFAFLSIYNDDGNFNFIGLLLKSILFGSFYFSANKIVHFLTTI